MIQLLFALPPQEQAFEAWKTEQFKSALTSPTSFLNAYALEQVPSGKSLFLILDEDKRKTRWVKTEPKNFFARAHHLGDKTRVTVKGKTVSYLEPAKGKRRKKLKLPNGAIAEVVHGKRVNKLWTYLYDPDQIKEFTGFRFYPFNTEAITSGIFKKTKPRVITYKTVQGDQTKVRKLGNISFSLQGKEYFLSAYNWQKPGEPISYLAVVFNDKTAGQETYGGGRELVIDLDGEPLKDNMKLSLDFNRTLNFYCAHSPFWHCPVGLQENLPVALKAGEMLPLKKIGHGKK